MTSDLFSYLQNEYLSIEHGMPAMNRSKMTSVLLAYLPHEYMSVEPCMSVISSPPYTLSIQGEVLSYPQYGVG